MQRTLRTFGFALASMTIVAVFRYRFVHAQGSTPCPTVTQFTQNVTQNGTTVPVTLVPMSSAAIDVEVVDSSSGNFSDTSSNNQVGAAQTAINNLAAVQGMNLKATTTNTDTMPAPPTSQTAIDAAVSNPVEVVVFAPDSTFTNTPGCNGPLPNGNPPDACTIPYPNGAGSTYYSITYLRASTMLNASAATLEPLLEHELGIATEGESDCVPSSTNDCSLSIANPVNTNTAPTPCDTSRIQNENSPPCPVSKNEGYPDLPMNVSAIS